jgi:hypothetical protein
MSKLVIVVPKERRSCGRAVLLGNDGSTLAGPLRVLATASLWAARRHGNEKCDWHKPFGHAPVGVYVIAGSLPPGVVPRPKRWRRFGVLGALVLQPVAGDALEAAKGGRRRFLVHGGAEDRRGRLRPTFGGIRLSDPDLGVLLRAVNDANTAHDPVASVELVETTSPTWKDEGPHDRAGCLRPSYLKPRRRRKARAGLPLGHAALMALGFGIAGRSLKTRGSEAFVRPARRDFVGLALLTIGAVGASACSSPPDDPSIDSAGNTPATPTVVGSGPAAPPPAGDPPDAGAGDDGGGPGGGYAGGPYGGDDTGGGGDDGTSPGGGAPGDDTGDDSSGGGGAG